MRRASKILAFLLCIITVILIFAVPISANQLFTDLMPDFWCYAKIIDFAQKGYMWL